MYKQLVHNWDFLSQEEQKAIANFVSKKMEPKNNNTAREVIDYLNQALQRVGLQKPGRGYQYADTHMKMIRSRLSQGHSQQDIFDVIDRKIEEWKNGTFIAQHLRPATLFNDEKFNNYIGQLDMTITPAQKPPLKFPPKDDLKAWQELSRKVGGHVNDTYGNIKAKARAMYDRGELNAI